MPATEKTQSLMMSKSASQFQRFKKLIGQSFLFTVTSLSAIAVLFIFYFIAKDAIPFFFDPVPRNTISEKAANDAVAMTKDLSIFGMPPEKAGKWTLDIRATQAIAGDVVWENALTGKSGTVQLPDERLAERFVPVTIKLKPGENEITISGTDTEGNPVQDSIVVSRKSFWDGWPFIEFKSKYLKEFFTGISWYPAADPGKFGALPIFYGSLLVTIGAILVAVPLGIAAAVCLSDILPFTMRQIVKPVIEILAAIPSVAYGFFALVVFAPMLQRNGGSLLSVGFWIVCLPVLALATIVIGDLAADKCGDKTRALVRVGVWTLLGLGSLWFLVVTGNKLGGLTITSGTNAFNVSIILGIMALPTVVSVSEDALQAVGRELREGSYALGATRAETLMKTIIPAALSGICAAVILGIMRAVGETMVVWMASGNAAQIPEPFYNFMAPVRTLTATIAGEMGEADQVTGSHRYHVLFAMAFCLLTFSFLMNLASEWVVRRSRKKLGK
jgi:phosphate transport system permease protein